jgi:hypothetical protein
MGGTLNLDQREAIASAWTRQGIYYLNRPQGAPISIPWFEAAIQLRRHFPLEQNPWYRYGLAAGWMNRGDAFSQLGEDHHLEESIRSSDQALDQLRHLPFEKQIEFRQRLVVAWSNRGQVLLQQGKNLRESIRSFHEAERFLTAEVPDAFFLKMGIWMNQATVHFQLDGDPFPMEKIMRAVLGHVKANEKTEVRFGEIALQSRHLLALSIGHQIDRDRHSQPVPSERISEITDILEVGIQLAFDWKGREERKWISHARILFCFGLQFYRTYLPHFLVEFIEDYTGAHKIPIDASLGTMIDEALETAESLLYEQTSKGILNSKDRSSLYSMIHRYHDLSRARLDFKKQRNFLTK